MKEIYQSINDVLSNDSDLKVMVGYSKKKLNIRRGYQPQGDWDSLVIYYMQGEAPLADFTSQIRTLILVVKVYNRTNDLVVEDVGERVILLLQDADLDVAGKLFVYNVEFTDDVIPTTYNQDLKAYERGLRFTLVVRFDGVVGPSGLPTRKRKGLAY